MFPPLVQDLRSALKRTLFAFLADPLDVLADQYGAGYLNDFEACLSRLRRAFPDRAWPAWLVDGYLLLNKEILREEKTFRETGLYSAGSEDLGRVKREVYDSQSVMEGYYLVGLLLTYWMWPHHHQMLTFFRERFLVTGDEIDQVSEWGVGHGLLTLTALEAWPRARAEVFDISQHSLSFAGRLLAGGRLERTRPSAPYGHPRAKPKTSAVSLYES